MKRNGSIRKNNFSIDQCFLEEERNQQPSKQIIAEHDNQSKGILTEMMIQYRSTYVCV